MIEVIYTDRRGAGCMRSFDEKHPERESVTRFISKLRRPAKVFLLKSTPIHKEQIGGVEPAYGPDDRRIKWHWWIWKEYDF